jgi:transmembrane sensor
MQKRNSYNKLEDFLFDSSFQRWVKLGEDSSKWEEWTLDNVERAKLVEEARLWILAMNVKQTPVSNKEMQMLLQKTWGKIKDSNDNKPVKRILNYTWFRVSAAILVFAVASLFYFKIDNNFFSENIISYQDLVEKESVGLIEQVNNSENPQLITLSDASSILLQPKSKLSYPKTFNSRERKVFLSGEAFFEISKNSKKPFYVYSNEVITKVYGTSFRIIAYSQQANVDVLVRTGKVKVSSNRNMKSASVGEVYLLQNQAARFDRKEQFFEKILDITQDKSLFASTSTIEKLSFEFKDIPVHQIFKTLEQAYLVTIDFPVEKLKACYLTTSLSDMPLPEKLKIICESLGFNTRYEMNGDHINIISDGCN